MSDSDLITYPESWYAFLSQTLLLRRKYNEHTFQLAGQGLGGMVIIPRMCVGGRQPDPDKWLWDAVLPSPPVKTAIIISPAAAMGVQAWELRTFLETFLSVVITGNNYKFLVSTLQRQLAVLDRYFLFHDPWRWWSHEEEMLKSHTLGTDKNHLDTILLDASLPWDASLS